MTTDSTRSRILEVMANAICDAIDAAGLVRPHAAASAALTAYESHLEAEGMVVVPGWQPIESAPKDGTPIRCGFQKGFHEAVGHWEYTTGDSGHFGVLESDMSFRPFKHQPSHWQPVEYAPDSGDGKASMQEASAEREARSEQIPPGKEESK